MPPRWRRDVKVVRDPDPYVNGPVSTRGLRMLVSGRDAPLSSRGRVVFYTVSSLIVLAGIGLVVLAR